MPKFKKNTDYSMKGSSFYGHGNSSPAKKEGEKSDETITAGVSDAALVGGDAKLMQQKFKHKEPAWAKVANAVAETTLMKGMESMAKGAARKAVAKGNPKTSKFLGDAMSRGGGTKVKDSAGSNKEGGEFQWGDSLDNDNLDTPTGTVN